jgi:hypothetical protein
MVTMCLEEYRKNGLLRALIPKMFLDYLKKYNREMGYTGIKRIIPFFRTAYMFGRAINPIIYHAVFASPMNISPPIDKNGDINVSHVSEKEINIRKNYLRKLGYTEDKINENLFVFRHILTDEKENTITHASMPLCPEAHVNKYFKENLGLEKGNALLILIYCRPLPRWLSSFPRSSSRIRGGRLETACWRSGNSRAASLFAEKELFILSKSFQNFEHRIRAKFNRPDGHPFIGGMNGR